MLHEANSSRWSDRVPGLQVPLQRSFFSPAAVAICEAI